MRFRLSAVLCAAAALSLPLAAQTVPTGYVLVYEAGLTDSNGVAANAQVCAQAVDVLGHPISVKPGGGGTTTTQQVCTNAVNGAWSMALPNTLLSTPAAAGFAITAIDNVSGQDLIGPGYGYVQPTSDPASKWCTVGAGCDMGKLPPMSKPSVSQTILKGYDGAPGTNGKDGAVGCPVGATACTGVVGTAPTGDQYVWQPSGTTFRPNSVQNETYAAELPGSDICTYVTNLLKSTYNADNFVNVTDTALAFVGAPMITIPRKTDGTPYECSTAILPPPDARMPTLIRFDPGAIIHQNAPVWTMDWRATINGGNMLDIVDPQLTGGPLALGGIRLGPGNGQRVTNPNIINFSRLGAGGVQFDGTDGQGVYGGQFGNNYDNFQWAAADYGPAKGALPNGTTTQGMHFYGAIHSNFYGYHGYGNRILDTVSDGSGSAGAGVLLSGNNTIIERNTVEAGATATKCYFVATTVAGSSVITVDQTVQSGTQCLVALQPVDDFTSGSLNHAAYIKSSSGSQVDVGYPALTSARSNMEAWITNPHVWELHSGTYRLNNNYDSDTGFHATFLLDAATATFVGNGTGGDEPAMMDLINMTASSNSVDVLTQSALYGYRRVTGTIISPNYGGFPVLKVCSLCGNDATDPNVLGVDAGNRGLRVNALVAPTSGLNFFGLLKFQAPTGTPASGDTALCVRATDGTTYQSSTGACK